MDQQRSRHTPHVLGLTGPIGCGKTTVGDILLELGARERIDADRVVHALMELGQPLSGRIGEEFGPETIRPDGGVNRAALGRIVFQDPDKLRLLESLTHPAVREEIRSRLESLKGTSGVVVLDAVKLLQSPLLPLTDEVWVVTCDPEIERARLTGLRGMTDEDAESRMRAQPSFEHPRVTRFVKNNGSLMELRQTVERAWSALNSSKS
jgi:dephospho-CoA kinase